MADVQKKYFNESEQFEVQMETKSILNREFTEQGGFQIPEVVDKIFKDHPDMKEEVQKNWRNIISMKLRWSLRTCNYQKIYDPAAVDRYRDRAEDPHGRI